MRTGALLAAVARRVRPEHPGWPAVLGPAVEHGRQVVMRPPRTGDAARWSELVRQDRESLEPWWPSSDRPWTERVTERVWRERCETQLRAARRGYLVPMVVQVDGQFGGEMALDRIDRGQGICELGGWVASQYRGSTVAVCGMQLLVRHAFGALGLRRILAPVGVGNRAAAILLARNGFRREGLLRAHMDVGGQLLDHQLWTLLPDDAEWTRAT